MEEQILELYGKLLELDKEKAENPMMDLSQRRAPILKQFIATIRENDEYDNPLLQEISSLKAKIVKLTEGHEADMKHNVFLAQTVSGLIKQQANTQKALDDKTNQLADIGKELESVNDTCEGLLHQFFPECSLKKVPFSSEVSQGQFSDADEDENKENYSDKQSNEGSKFILSSLEVGH